MGGRAWVIPAYAIDDETAIRVVDGAVEVVSEGNWRPFAPNAAAVEAQNNELELAELGVDVRAAAVGDDAAAWRSLEEAQAAGDRPVDVLDRVGLLADRDGQRRQPHGAAPELLDHAAQQPPVEPLQAGVVDLEQRESLLGDLRGDCSLVAHLGDVADAAKDAVRDPRRAARPTGNELGRVVGDLDGCICAERRTMRASSSG